MPLYTFEHPVTKEQVNLVQRMNDTHEYTDETGVKWLRLFAVPQARIDNKIDPFSEKEFVRKTSGKNLKLGDMWDLSAELSAKREKVVGKDPVKEKAAAAYYKKTKKKHPLA
jgi:hypothetical protein